MKTLARLVLCVLVTAVATVAIATGIGGAVLLPTGAHALASFGLAGVAVAAAALAIVDIADMAPDVLAGIAQAVTRVRRRSWRSFAAVLAGQSTAMSRTSLSGAAALAVLLAAGTARAEVGKFVTSNATSVSIGRATAFRVGSATLWAAPSSSYDDAPTSVQMKIWNHDLAKVDSEGVHLAPGVDLDGHPIATVGDVMRAESRCVVADSMNAVAIDSLQRQLDRHGRDRFALALVTALGGGAVGGFFISIMGLTLFARTFSLRRWISRADRSRMKREAEQGTFR